MAVETTAASGEVNHDVINEAHHSTAQELLCITESAVDALSRNRSQPLLTTRDRKNGPSIVTVQARNTEDVENISTESCSSTASEIPRRSTHTSAAFGVKSSLPHFSEAARLVRVPVKVLREVPVPRDGMFSGRMPPTPCDNFKPYVALQSKSDRLVSADQSQPDETRRSKSDGKVKQHSKKMHSDARESAEVDNPKISRKPSASRVETNGRMKLNEMPEGNSAHPLMAILDNRCLTQPIHTIVAEERLSSGNSDSTSMFTASPIDVLAEDKQAGRS